jgi:hypothetical protein
MPRFRVTAVMETDLYCVVEANSREEAMEKAERRAWHGTLVEEINGGGLRICEAWETEENLK